MSPPLPFELIELIINHLPKLVDLQSAALISRAWFIPSQHALFRSLDLQDLPVARLCTHLRRYPHLQSYIHHVIMIQRDGYLGDPPNTDHLTAMFSLMPKLISLEISFDRYRLWGRSDELFVKAFGTFLRDTSSLNAIGIHGLRYEEDFQQMFLYLEDTMIKRVNLQLDGYDSDEDEDQDDHGRVKFFTSTLAVVRLPQVEIVRFQLWCPPLIIEGLKLWFLEHQTMFPRLKHLEIGLDDTEDFEFWLQDILHPIQTLRLESVRIEFDSILANELIPAPDINLLDVLHVDHLKFGFYYLENLSDVTESSSQAEFYIWLSSQFCLLRPECVHFTDFTIAVADSFHSGPMWGKLDDALSLEAFGKVKHVHFETRKEKFIITDLAHPHLASDIRSALPRLDSRGVLCFV